MRISLAHIAACVLIITVAPTWSQEGQGLDPSTDRWLAGQWHARIELSPGPSHPSYANPYTLASQIHGTQRPGISVLGDFFFKSPASSTPSLANFSGFRATSGLMPGPRGFSNTTNPGAMSDGKNSDPGAVPYFGVGYTDFPSRAGWGFSADFGLMALSPRSAIKLGGVLGGPQNIDDLLRDLRLSPLLQLGVSYSF